MNKTIRVLFNNAEHLNACHNRWLKHRNNWQPGIEEENLTEEWYDQQCGSCQFFVPLAGVFESDWGVCTNSKSNFDRRAMFEHDGCNCFAPANTWVADELHQQKSAVSEDS